MRHITLLLALLCTAAGYAQPATDSSGAFVLGTVRKIHSAVLGENRILNIYLPAGYGHNDTARYPVIYLLDGSADEDFIHIAGLVQFNSLPWVYRLPETIVVGIANADRKRDFTYPSTVPDELKRFPTTGGSTRFTNYLEKEVVPYVEANFRTGKTRTIIGQSLGGLLCTEILFTCPELFDNYIIISPSLWWDNGSLLARSPRILEAGYAKPTKIYIGVGKEGLGPSSTPHVMEVDANLLAEKLKNGKSKAVTTYFDYLPTENHATITHHAVTNAIETLWKP